MEGLKYGILKSGPYWRIGVSIADSDIFTPSQHPNTVTPPVFGTTPQLSVFHNPTQSSAYTKKHTADLTDNSPAVKL